jgi:hypothetical protein
MSEHKSADSEQQPTHEAVAQVGFLASFVPQAFFDLIAWLVPGAFIIGTLTVAVVVSVHGMDLSKTSKRSS